MAPARNMEVYMKTWVSILTIPGYLVQGIGDNGMVETVDDNGKTVDSDDLRISIELSAGHKVLLDGCQRIVLKDDGDLEIQTLRDSAQ